MTVEEMAAHLVRLSATNSGSGKTLETVFREELAAWKPVFGPQISYGTTTSNSWPTTWTTSPPPVVEPLSAEERAGYREQFEAKAQCIHCGGLHLRACPRVKRIVMRNSEEISEVEFWPSWPTEHIIFPEDVYEEAADGTEDAPGRPAGDGQGPHDRVAEEPPSGLA
jgi:hypothetical protein